MCEIKKSTLYKMSEDGKRGRPEEEGKKKEKGSKRERAERFANGASVRNREMPDMQWG